MDFLGIDFADLFNMYNLLVIIAGAFVGMIFGALPGLGVAVALVLLLPFTFYMPPLTGILLLLSAYQSGEYGGSISAVLLNIPGTPQAYATTFDGYPLAKKSYPGKALGYSLTASTIGGLFGALILIFLSIPFSEFALRISDPEYFLLGMLGLIAVVGVSSIDVVKTLISIVLGLMVGTVGQDLITGLPRFTMDQSALLGGVSLIALIVGLFAIPEIISLVSEELYKKHVIKREGLRTKITWKEFKGVSKSMSIGSIMGGLIGILPGLGSGASSILSYTAAKNMSKQKDTFGHGSPEGIAAPESSNNATVGGALIPMLTLGIPGSVGTAIIMRAFIIHGVQPGPQLFEGNAKLVNGILYGFVFTTIIMYIMGRFITPVFARVLTIPNRILIPAILSFAIIGVFSSNYLFFDLWVALFIGVFGFIIRKLDFSLIGFLLAFILCPIIEESLRRTMVITDGSFSIFFTRGYSLIILSIIVLILLFRFMTWYKSVKSK